jgi:hypothetical protein
MPEPEATQKEKAAAFLAELEQEMPKLQKRRRKLQKKLWRLDRDIDCNRRLVEIFTSGFHHTHCQCALCLREWIAEKKEAADA